MAQPIDIKKFDFFTGFSNDLYDKIAPLFEIKTYPKGQNILEQGQPNRSIYFLSAGQVGVYFDGEKINQLSEKGEIFGEISVIKQSTVSATLKAETDCTLHVIDTTLLDKFDQRSKEQFTLQLYRFSLNVIIQRLLQTNDKAKRFEKANVEIQEAQIKLKAYSIILESEVEKRTQELSRKARELEGSYVELERKNFALLAGTKKVEELAHIKDKALEKVRSLSEDHLVPLQEIVNKIQATASTEQGQDLKTALYRLKEVEIALAPLNELYKSEKSLESKRVLLADSQKKQQVIAKMALGGTGVSLEMVSDIAEGIEKLSQNSYDLIFCDIELSELVDRAAHMGSNCEFVFMTSQDVFSSIEQLKKYPSISNVISRDQDDRIFTVKNIVTTVTKLLNQDIFGLEKYLAWGVDVQVHQVTSSKQRLGLIDDMLAHFKGLGIRSSILGRAQVSAEEMLMNAIFDAPCDASGKPLYNYLPRTNEVVLKDSEVAKFRYACDGVLLAVSVEDPFGALTKDIIVNYLESCYTGKAGSIDTQKSGAGRGLHQMVESSDLVVFNVKKDYRTEVIAIYNIESAATRKEVYPSLHYFFR